MSLELILTILVLGTGVGTLLLTLRNGGSDKGGALDKHLDALTRGQERLEKTLRDEMGRNREESNTNERAAREELGRQLLALTQLNEQKLDSIRQALEQQLKGLREENSIKLDQMRQVVDEKLQATLEKRLNDSFRLVSERLEQVHQGLGEMQSLAADVGALQRTLTNVKTRGTWGEVQLEGLLQQILSPDQYVKNIATREGSNDRVEFAIRLPGREPGKDSDVWLPVDAKFPQEDYQRLVDAVEKGDAAAAAESSKSLVSRIKLEARNIKEKYLDPPHTTDFGILFLPTEGLYAEALRHPGLLDSLQRDYRIVITGPTTLAAILNSLQVGFRTLAIEKRSGEVWNLLGMVKKEFGLFAGILEKTQKKLQEASNTIDDAAKKTRTIEKRLKNVEASTASLEAASDTEAAKEMGGDGDLGNPH